MTPIMTHAELQRNAAKFITLRVLSSAKAWPRIGHDVLLVDEDGPIGSLLFSCHTDESMSNPLGIVHGGVTASLVDTCMGITCAAQCGGAPTPTITMTVNYARPIPLGAEVHVRTHTVRVGSTSGQISSEVFLARDAEEILVTATGVYAIKH